MRHWNARAVGFVLALAALTAGPARGQFQPGRYKLTPEERAALTAGRDHLKQRLAPLRSRVRPNDRAEWLQPDPLPDAEVFLEAVDRCLAQDLFFSKGDVTRGEACLKEGEARVDALLAGQAPWLRQSGVVILGYRSEIDGSVQPYQAYLPPVASAGAAAPKRLDLFLHGRGGNLSEIAFLRGRGWVKGNFGAQPPSGFALYPYGRGNNGWRYAGERDVYEALDNFRRRFPVDPDRISLRGFSMGGHGVWHIGLQHPGDWSAMSPGAGFVETRIYHKLVGPLPIWQEALLHLYDPLDYAVNGKNVPILHYVGETDAFHAQHQIMDAMLKKESVPYQEFIGPQTGHRYEPRTLEALLAEFTPFKREPLAPDVDFVTYTLRFPECKWVRIEGLKQHWQRAEIHARRTGPGRIDVTTRNVTAFRLNAAGWSRNGIVTIDGKRVDPKQTVVQGGRETPMLFRRSGVRWLGLAGHGLTTRPGLDDPLKSWRVRKRPGLQGPIDDVAFGPILAVAGTGTAWNAAAQIWSGQELSAFREGWGRYCRATLPETTDTALTPEQVKNSSLVLFGDPGSNAVLRRILAKLPVRWTRDKITIAGKSFSAKNHLPVLIFPNPENPRRYVVLNIGFTFSRADMDGSNSQQYPHLPDFAVLRIGQAYTDDRSTNTELAGFFDERWAAPMLR